MDAQLLPLKAVDDLLLGQWEELARHALEPNPSFEPGMTINAAKLLPGAPQLDLLLVHDQRRLQLLLPVTRLSRYRHIPVPVLTSWPPDYSLLGTPLVSPENPVGALGAAVALLARDRIAPWWVLDGVSCEGPVTDALHEAVRHHGLRATSFLPHSRRAVLRRRDDDHLEGLISTKSRKALRRRRRRLSEAVDGEVQTVDAAHLDLDTAVEGFLRVEAEGWKGQDGGAFLSRPGHADFFRAVCRDFESGGRLQFYTLGTSSTSVAYQCNLLAQDRVFNFKVAYDEDYRRFTPGVLLELDVLEDFHAQDRMASIDSCTSPEDEGVHVLMPDTLDITTLLVPLPGLRGRVATRATPVVTAAGARLRQWRPARHGA